MRSTVLAVLFASAAAVAATDFPPLCVEISPEHPLLIFRDPGGQVTEVSEYAEHVIRAWGALPEEMKPLATIQVEARGPDIAARHQWFKSLLPALQTAEVPTVLRLADADARRIYPLNRAEELVREFSCIKGILAADLSFEEYYEFGADDPIGTPPNVRWLIAAVDLAARYGRFIVIELDQIRWPRVMSNVWCRPLYQKLRDCRAYTVPIAEDRGQHTIPQTAALLGLWLEGATGQWGIGPDSRWYTDANFIKPGLFGPAPTSADGLSETRPGMPPALYRAMIMNGAMTGACAYSFDADSDLWFGSQHSYWDEAIYPTLSSLVDRGLIARQDFVKKKIKVAYQLAPARTSEDFHVNLRDIDGVLDAGRLMNGAYGMERPGQVAELIPNTGRHYWVPILSAHAPQTVLASFDLVVQPGTQASAESWAEMLDGHYRPDGEGAAFITRVGRGTFIMNTRENTLDRQTFRIDGVPTPVRGFQVKRQADGVLITWPFREGDLSYRIYRRTLPETSYTLLANAAEGRRFLDVAADPDQTVAYAVTALTDEMEPYEGAVDYGEYLAVSNVESRIVEEAVITPLLGFADSRPTESSTKTPAPPKAWWPDYTGVTEEQKPVAEEIVKRIEAWDRAFTQKDLNGVLAVYSTEYEDPQAWPFPYVRRAYQWFFEHYRACTIARQIRQWDFTEFDALRRVGVLLYTRFQGYAFTDPTGRTADMPAYFPQTPTGEVWIYFSEQDGAWRITKTDPALPNFKDILIFSASPYDKIVSGPDL